MAKTKSQAALEFLVTYSWAFLALLITFGALYYFGIFDFGKFLPEKCTFTSQLECLNFVMISDEIPEDSIIRLKIVNNLGETITAESFTFQSDYNFDCIILPVSIPGWVAGDEQDIVFSSCSGGGFIPKDRVEARISITYFAPATSANPPRHTVNGKIQGIVQ